MRNHYSNLVITILFMVLNPLYALFITTVYSVITNKVSNLLIGALYVLSFSLIFTNQFFLDGSDLGGYIDMYKKTEFNNIASYFQNFLQNVNGREFLWFFYCLLIGELTSFNPEVFVFTTYLIIFSLSAYLAFLVCENGRYNFSLMLFSLIFFELTFLDVGYDLWRNIISILVFFVGVMRYFSFQSIIIPRVLIYSSVFFHITILPLLALFEFYVLFMNRNNRYMHLNISVLLKISLLAFISIISGLYFSNLVVDLFGSDVSSPLYKGINKYLENKNVNFNFMHYLRPLYIMFIAYIVLNWKQLSHFDIFIVFTVVVIQFLDHLSTNLGMVFSRISISNNIGILFLSIKLLKRFNYKYIVAFVFVIFSLRMYNLIFRPNLFFIEYLANGEFFNPIYGLIYSIFYFHNPSFDNFLNLNGFYVI